MQSTDWCRDEVVYQVYPRSFKDSNNDGVGDLAGIIEKLDYLKELGVTTVWLSPVYASPNDDNGYDISNYFEIQPEFGTMQDMKNLIEALHQRSMKCVMDLVVNHTSDEHIWFQRSKASKDPSNPYRDYYVWRPAHPERGGPPNNWESFFSGSAWDLDATTDEYYLHLFTPKQPDLNWENPAVREEVSNIVKFWVDFGVDGFRMDVINCISKNVDLPDGSQKSKAPQFLQWSPEHFVNGPKMQDYLNTHVTNLLRERGVFSVGETPMTDAPQAAAMTGRLPTAPAAGSMDMLIQFEFHDLQCDYGGEWNKWSPKPWTVPQLKEVVDRWMLALQQVDGWCANYISNHDQPRAVSHWGCDASEEERKVSAKCWAIYNFCLRGTPFIYQGEELGMTNCAWTLDECRDVEIIRFAADARQRGLPEATMLEWINWKGRDNARTPFPWTANGGFSSQADVTPWLKMNPNFPHINAQDNVADPTSVWHCYRQLIALRRECLLLRRGDYIPMSTNHPSQVLAWGRGLLSQPQSLLLVVLNLRGGAVEEVQLSCRVREWNQLLTSPTATYQLLLGNVEGGCTPLQLPLKALAGWEGCVFMVSSRS